MRYSNFFRYKQPPDYANSLVFGISYVLIGLTQQKGYLPDYAAPLASLSEGGGELASRRECHSRNGTRLLIYDAPYLRSQDTPSASQARQLPRYGGALDSAKNNLITSTERSGTIPPDSSRIFRRLRSVHKTRRESGAQALRTIKANNIRENVL